MLKTVLAEETQVDRQKITFAFFDKIYIKNDRLNVKKNSMR